MGVKSAPHPGFLGRGSGTGTQTTHPRRGGNEIGQIAEPQVLADALRVLVEETLRQRQRLHDVTVEIDFPRYIGPGQPELARGPRRDVEWRPGT